MQAFVEALNGWGDTAATLAVAAVWQSTVVALLVALVAYALRSSSSAVRYWLWQLVAIKLLLMPFWSSSLPVPWLPAEAAAVAVRPPSPAGVLPHPAQPSTGNHAVKNVKLARPRNKPLARHSIAAEGRTALAELSWQGWLLCGWATIVVLQLGRLGVQRVRLARLLRACDSGDDALSRIVEHVAARIQLRGAPRVLVTELQCSPFVCGIVEPALVVPRELTATLAAVDLEQIVAHELAHVKRRDLVWGWIPEIARIVYFFHPVAHWAASRVRLERELACDAVAIADSGRSPAEYADTLVRVLTNTSSPSIFRTAAAPLDGGNGPTTPEERMP